MGSYKDRNNRPRVSEPEFQYIPLEMAKLAQWVLWRFDWSEERGEWAKVPYQITGLRASSTNPATWAQLPACVNAFEGARASYDGIGFVFTAESPYVGIDLDNCVAVEDEQFQLTQFAARVVDKLASYTEFSPSKNGLHIIGRAGVMAAMRTDWNGNAIEIYRTGRYFTFTGLSWHEDVSSIRDVHADLAEIMDKLRKPLGTGNGQQQGSQGGIIASAWAMTVEDRLRLALRNQKLAALFEGDTSEYGGDDSRADFALCRLLAYYCDGRADVLDSMFRASKLFRGKWDDKRADSTYGAQTIQKILDSQKCFLGTRGKHESAQAVSTYESRRVRRFTVDDLWDAAMAYRHSGGSRGVSPGWVQLERLYRPRRGLMSIVTGEPGSGKSTFVDCVTANIATSEGWIMTYASFETQPLQRHILDLCQIYLGKPTFAFLQGSATDDEMEIVREALRPFFHFILPDDDELNIDCVLDYIDDEIRDFGIAGFVLDPWSELDGTRDLRQAQTDFIEAGLRKLRRFTRQRDIHTWLIAHPTKGGDTYKNGRPTLRSIAGSAHYYNKADYGLVIHRTDDDHTSVFVDKVRFSEVGQRGDVEFRYDPDARAYYPIYAPLGIEEAS